MHTGKYKVRAKALALQKEKALSWLVTDLDFRKKAASIIAKLNRKKAKPENMRRDAAHYERLAKKKKVAAIHGMMTDFEYEAGIIRPEIAQAIKNKGLTVADVMGCAE